MELNRDVIDFGFSDLGLSVLEEGYWEILDKLLKFGQLRAKAQSVVRDNKECWRGCVSGLGSVTGAGSVWDVMGRMAGRFLAGAIDHLSVNGNRVASGGDCR